MGGIHLYPYSGATSTKSMGKTNNIAKFGMERIELHWASGVVPVGTDGQPGQKIRLYDMCVRSTTTRLCDDSGQGG